MNLCKPPDPLRLSGNNDKNWREFKEQLVWFLEGTESTGKSDGAKIGIMLSHAGREARELYKTLPWAAEGDDKKFNKVLEAFERFCSSQKNLLYERHGFWQLSQQDGEPVDAYLTRLKLKVDYCEYDKEGWIPAVKAEMLRDKFIFGIRDDALKERLLRETGELTLERAVSLAQRSESSKLQVKEMSTSTVSLTCDEIKPQRTKFTSKIIACGQCGRTHRAKECPAYGQECTRCHKLHHFARVCRSKQHTTSSQPTDAPVLKSQAIQTKNVFTLEDSESLSTDSESNLLIDPIRIDGLTKPSAWLSTLSTLQGNITLKLDTGAEANILPISTYNKFPLKPPLHPTNTKLTAYGGTSLSPIGVCSLDCNVKGSQHNVEFFVLDVDSQRLLGLKDCEQMGLIKRIDTVVTGQLTKQYIKLTYRNVFTGLGSLGKYHITLCDNATPIVNPPRRVPCSLKQRLRTAIDTNVASGVLVKVDEPTDWVHNLVIVEKKNGSLRLCLDPRHLNQVIKREHYKIPTIQDIASDLRGKTVFSTLDLKDGYWQVELDTESSLLCTFNTPFGRYRFTRMPFGLKSASEVFQKKNEAVFEGISGVHIVSDDIIVAAATEEEHDKILTEVLDRAKAHNVKLNYDKLQLRVPQVKYLGTIISKEGMKPDPTKVQAISEIPTPSDKSSVRRLLGMINFLAPHIPDMATILAPLRELLKADVHFQWNSAAENALTSIKRILSTQPVLQFFDPALPSVIQADASQHGLGACLMQQGKPIAYASRSLSSSEVNYAQIEKELLAIVFACSKFHYYIYGFHTKIQSDHKPLEAIFKKPLHQASPRLQRMLLRLQKYDLNIKYVSGKHLYVADTLSRAHCADCSEDIDSAEIQFAVHTVVKDFPITDKRLIDLQEATKIDSTLQRLKHFIEHGWPTNIVNVPQVLHDFWKIRDSLCIAGDLILFGNRLVVPKDRQKHILKCIHEGHFGIEKCKARARTCVYWPNMNNSIEQEVKSCSICNTYSRANQKEPLLSHSVPLRPWDKVGADHFTFAATDYLIVVDYFSKYPEVIKVKSKCAETTVEVMKAIFARNGIPTTVVADNVPFNSRCFKEFAKEWQFNLTTSSPHFPQSNGLAERNVQTVKNLFKKAKESGRDPEMALLEFRNTPITGLNSSPAQLLMGRRLRSILPMISTCLDTESSNEARGSLIKQQQRSQAYFNRQSKPLNELKTNDVVRLKHGNRWKKAVVLSKHTAPRSYILKTVDGAVLR